VTARRNKTRARRAKQDLYRQLVLEGAERVFAEKGYDDAKMEEIALQSGLSLGTLYSVFSGKAEVFGAIHENADRELLRVAAVRVEEDSGPLEAVLAGLRGTVEYFLQHPDFLRMHLREGQTWGAEIGGRGRERSQAWRDGLDMLSHSIRRCIDEGIFHEGDPELMARMTIAMQQVQLAHWIETGMKREPEEVVADVLLQVRRSFCRAARDRS
jgi:AcrR family transcriptional regulator